MNDFASEYQDGYYYVDDEELELELKDDYYALVLSDDWDIITNVWKQFYYDDGEGYIELGYDD